MPAIDRRRCESTHIVFDNARVSIRANWPPARTSFTGAGRLLRLVPPHSLAAPGPFEPCYAAERLPSISGLPQRLHLMPGFRDLVMCHLQSGCRLREIGPQRIDPVAQDIGADPLAISCLYC